MASSNVMGFTEAEIGLVLAALFVVVAGSQLVRGNSALTEVQVLRDSVARLENETMRLRRERDSLAGRRSRQTPLCSEKGERKESVARVLVNSEAEYLLNGNSMSLNEVLAALKPWLDLSASLGCRFHIDVVTADPAMRSDEFVKGSERLAPYFNLRRGLDGGRPTTP